MKKLILMFALVLAFNVANACDEYWNTYSNPHCENGVIVYDVSTQGMNRVYGGGTYWYEPCGEPYTGTQPTSICC